MSLVCFHTCLSFLSSLYNVLQCWFVCLFVVNRVIVIPLRVLIMSIFYPFSLPCFLHDLCCCSEYKNDIFTALIRSLQFNNIIIMQFWSLISPRAIPEQGNRAEVVLVVLHRCPFQPFCIFFQMVLPLPDWDWFRVKLELFGLWPSIAGRSLTLEPIQELPRSGRVPRASESSAAGLRCLRKT